jgi:hypothetical protein
VTLRVRDLASERKQNVKARLAGSLYITRQTNRLAQLAHRDGCAYDVGERCLFRIEIDHAPIRLLQRPHTAIPNMHWDGAEVGDVEKCLDAVADEVANVAL